MTKGEKTLYDKCLQRMQVVYHESYDFDTFEDMGYLFEKSSTKLNLKFPPDVCNMPALYTIRESVLPS